MPYHQIGSLLKIGQDVKIHIRKVEKIEDLSIFTYF